MVAGYFEEQGYYWYIQYIYIFFLDFTGNPSSECQRNTVNVWMLKWAGDFCCTAKLYGFSTRWVMALLMVANCMESYKLGITLILRICELFWDRSSSFLWVWCKMLEKEDCRLGIMHPSLVSLSSIISSIWGTVRVDWRLRQTWEVSCTRDFCYM